MSERMPSGLTRDELTRKYIEPPSSLRQAGIVAEAEQVERSMRDLRAACEDYNGPELAWLLWELPPPLRERIDGVRTQLREAQARDGRDETGPRLVFYTDDRNKYDEANGWPAFRPDDPHDHNVPFGVMVWAPDTVHVLRGGCRERVVPANPRAHQSFADEARELGLNDLPDFGPAYDFDTFMAQADYLRMIRYCDMQVAADCVPFGIGGGETRLIAIPTGQYVWALTMCESCKVALGEAQRAAHPEWRDRYFDTYRPEVNPFHEAVYGASNRRRA